MSGVTKATHSGDEIQICAGGKLDIFPLLSFLIEDSVRLPRPSSRLSSC